MWVWTVLLLHAVVAEFGMTDVDITECAAGVFASSCCVHGVIGTPEECEEAVAELEHHTWLGPHHDLRHWTFCGNVSFPDKPYSCLELGDDDNGGHCVWWNQLNGTSDSASSTLLCADQAEQPLKVGTYVLCISVTIAAVVLISNLYYRWANSLKLNRTIGVAALEGEDHNSVVAVSEVVMNNAVEIFSGGVYKYHEYTGVDFDNSRGGIGGAQGSVRQRLSVTLLPSQLEDQNDDGDYDADAEAKAQAQKDQATYALF